ncbi:MAG: GNVR domain-containing protein [Acidobacteriaceae bacterium]|jgi:capsule polysaccharide export protein KpsE/RkpR
MVMAGDEAWVRNAALLWAERRMLARVGLAALVVSAVVAFAMPKQYESTTRILPPEQTSGSAAMLAALAGRGTGSSGLAGLAGMAGGLLGGHGEGPLFVSLLRSDTISGHLIGRFNLQHVYRKRYVTDTTKKLARKTQIDEDTKSGVITITVEDTDRARARDMAQAYVDELNLLVARVNTSSARREREFIEQRLQTVGGELERAQVEMSDFSTKHAAIDIKEQTRAMVDAGARLEGQLVASESELDSLEQVYGDGNVRVKAAEARVGALRRELVREDEGSGARGNDGDSDSSSPSEGKTNAGVSPLRATRSGRDDGRIGDGAGSGRDDDGIGSGGGDAEMPYPGLRQLPALAVPWADLYRRVRIEETVYEMLSEQYETARIEEAKSIATVSVVDAAGWPEKKSSPHRLLIVVGSTGLALVGASLFLLGRRRWMELDEGDGRRVLARDVAGAVWKRRG